MGEKKLNKRKEQRAITRVAVSRDAIPVTSLWQAKRQREKQKTKYTTSPSSDGEEGRYGPAQKSHTAERPGWIRGVFLIVGALRGRLGLLGPSCWQAQLEVQVSDCNPNLMAFGRRHLVRGPPGPRKDILTLKTTVGNTTYDHEAIHLGI